MSEAADVNLYTPDGAFTFLVLVVGLTLLAAVVYLLVFTSAAFL